MTDASSLKDQGNKAFASKDYDAAIKLFSEAISLDPSNHVLYSNRSAAKAGKRLWKDALEDAEACMRLNPSWAKGYARKGAALHGMRKYDEAIAAYEEGLKFEDNPALRKGLKEVQDAKAHEFSDDSNVSGLGNLFGDPSLIGKLAANPKTSKYLSDPAFMNTLLALQKNPKLASSALQDPRMIEVMGVLMGIDLQAFSRESEGTEAPTGSKLNPSSPSPPPAATSDPQQSARTEADVSVKEPEEQDPESIAEKKARAEAEEQKRIGSEAYRKRDSATAAAAFERAWELWPKDISFLTNLGASYFEQAEYNKCIETCQKAVDEGRELRADYKLIAKAYGRIGSAYRQKGDLDAAINSYNKSLTEHRTPDILSKLREAEREKAAAEAIEYVSPELSEKAREEGNAKFKTGDFVGALNNYTESIKRNPKDPRGYNNRSLCYTKLAALPEALKDVEEAIKIDPKFIKAYIRKASVMYSMREYVKALETLQQAAELDIDGSHTKEIQQQMIKCNQALSAQRAGESEQETLERAIRDPEIAKIMGDPVMQQILQQAQQDPSALQEHMKNPVVRENIIKLVNAGIIKTR